MPNQLSYVLLAKVIRISETVSKTHIDLYMRPNEAIPNLHRGTYTFGDGIRFGMAYEREGRGGDLNTVAVLLRWY